MNDYLNNSYSSIQAEADAGFDIWSMPNPAAASYERTIDYGADLSGSLITVSLTPVAVSGVVDLDVRISYSPDGNNWTSGDLNQLQIFGVNFRYIRVRVDFQGGGNALTSLEDLQIRLDRKLRSDVGSGTSLASDTNGTQVDFNIEFIDIESINVTARGSDPITAIYDFVDASNPTSFNVYLFDQQGNRASGEFSWRAEGY